jgi:hypothetical protein
MDWTDIEAFISIKRNTGLEPRKEDREEITWAMETTRKSAGQCAGKTERR